MCFRRKQLSLARFPISPLQPVVIAPMVPVQTASKRLGSVPRSYREQVSTEASHHAETTEVAVRSSRLHHAVEPATKDQRVTRPAMGPSFECRRPVSEVTRTICGDPQLAALDRRLAARFSLLDRSVDPATIQALHHGETTFLNARQSCADKACLADNYLQRLRELNNVEP